MGKAKRTVVADKKSDDRIRIEYDKAAFATLFNQMSGNLAREFPALATSGKSYPLPPTKSKWVTLVFLIQVVLVVAIMFGETIVEKLSLELAPVYLQKYRENKFMALPIVMMLSPVRQMLSNTGAFEVHLNDELVYSMLETRSLLTFETLKKILADKNIRPMNAK
ncbi:hypothetical protein SPRG_02238 [Saprolegnia parasitica CBS 223.65]|uniref:Uncharacterized protein n=1 Tax=Saprolegnia parasitica (strain CBS 223.65) TaxID=695850 RepID=A0A067D3V2_SAPPC|nr:hypothetical protein SPRG_02238 [Saprolegnia parasitica CBS 223.65]KDO33431.1 hypothetical protein SPRG_02238 [Saprolegnia parasitica CBS 223.65]|eukprot:XP_012196177.1 hypothetical protein SPRG_02238 [Saprolegnia parasitica CBS 223.65]